MAYSPGGVRSDAVSAADSRRGTCGQRRTSTGRRGLPTKGLTATCALFAVIALTGCATIDGATVLRAAQPICRRSGAYAPAARYNAAAARYLAFAPFGRPEQGWRIYEPRIQSEIHTDCPAETPNFAEALAQWQHRHGLAPDGALQPATFETMKAGWQGRRPFVVERLKGLCPDPPGPEALTVAAADESYGGKTIPLRPGTLRAYRHMAAALGRALPEARVDPDALRLFSGYRSPGDDAARCMRDANCDGLVRAVCSAHRTGLALDLVVGVLPGRPVDSTADDNRLYQSQTPVYRWLVAHAGRYGFVNYVFEPWHWEWTGEPP